MPPYCGGKPLPPRGRTLATREEECVRQVRTFGRRVVRDENAARALNGARWGSGKNCGKRTPSSVQGNCAQQFRLYGLLPIIDSVADLRRKTFVAGTAEEHARFPRVRFHPPHPYTQNRYEGNIQRGAISVFCSIVWSQAEDAATMNPQSLPDGVGFGFGYFLPRFTRGNVITFNIVHVNVNPPYRRGGATASADTSISSYVVRELVKGITQRARTVHPAARSVLVQVDPDAPCFQLGNPQYMSARRSNALEAMYTGAGFTVVPLPFEGPSRRKVEMTVKL